MYTILLNKVMHASEESDRKFAMYIVHTVCFIWNKQDNPGGFFEVW